MRTKPIIGYAILTSFWVAFLTLMGYITAWWVPLVCLIFAIVLMGVISFGLHLIDSK